MIKRALYNCPCGNHGDDNFEGVWSQKCSVCGRHQTRYTIRYHDNKCEEIKNKGGVDALIKESPRWSWSMGVNPADIPAMLKRYPDRSYRPDTGQLLVKSRQHKKQLMKEHGMQELS